MTERHCVICGNDDIEVDEDRICEECNKRIQIGKEEVNALDSSCDTCKYCNPRVRCDVCWKDVMEV